MNLRDFEYLVTLAETGHFGQAAARCHVSQPTLSTQLKKLEETLGVPLVERHPRKVVLTAPGQAVVARARDILRLTEDIKNIARAAQDPLAGLCRLGLIPTVGPYLLPYLVPALKERAPRLKPQLVEAQTHDLLTQLRAGQLDAAILALPLPDTDDLETLDLYAEPFYLAAPVGHPLGQQGEVDAQALLQADILLLEEGHCLRDQALDVCRRVGAKENTEFRATSLETLRHMVLAGAGITLLPALALQWHKGVPGSAGLVITPFRAPVPERRIALMWRRGSYRSGAMRQLGAALVAQLQTQLPAGSVQPPPRAG